jgi:hypothetical protein
VDIANPTFRFGQKEEGMKHATGMYDELKILPLFWWTSECTCPTYLQMQDSPAVDLMYENMIQEKSIWWL